ncbi:MAG TPA: choice-of-anchor Q domain-containing protein, partial [Rubricoccaceae bacterium]|nr:choice-of-anchor Q domain-containing protein [Rubricoccaceae bacterium]
MNRFLLPLTLLAVPLVAGATTRYVAPGGTDTGDCSVAAAPCATIAYAVGQADDGDLIAVAAGAYAAGAVLDRDVAVEGAGRRATKVAGAFTVNAGVTAALRDLTVQGARVTNHGNATLERVTVRDNVGTGVVNDGTMAIIDGTVANNDCSYSACLPGGIRNYGALTLLRTGVVDNDSFESNGWGGGLYNGPNATATAIESLFEGNSHLTEDTDTGWGGGIHNEGALTVLRSTIRNNVAEVGGGISSEDEQGSGNVTLVIDGSTISNNYAAIECGALIWYGESAAIRNSTISGNDGGLCGDVTIEFSTITGNGLGNYYGSGVLAGDVVLRNTVVAGNEADCTLGDGDGGPYTITSFDYNVLGPLGAGCVLVGDTEHSVLDVDDPQLGPLAPNGGPTRTHAPLPGSPVLNAGTCTDIDGDPVTEDQRGASRPFGPACDVGAVEQGAFIAALSVAPVAPPTVIPAGGGEFAFTFAVTNLTAEPQTLDAWAEATPPDGPILTAPYGPLRGPVTITLGPGETVERTLVQRVPASAMGGYWTYAGNVGTYPDGAVASDAFPVTKQHAASRARGRPARAATEGAGWPLVYA